MIPERSHFERQWRKRFGRFARAREDDAGIAGWTETGLEARVRRFRKIWFSDSLGRLWLDAGCGAGTYSRILDSRRLRVIGLDYSIPSLFKAQSRKLDCVNWLAGDVTCIPLRTECVDGVLCFGVLQALSKAGPAIGELYRVMKPGGQLWIDGLNVWCLPHLFEAMIRWLQRRDPHTRYDSPWDVKRQMFAAGFDRVEVHWLPILPAPVCRFQPLLEHPLVVTLLQRLLPLGALLSHSFILYGERTKGLTESESRLTDNLTKLC